MSVIDDRRGTVDGESRPEDVGGGDVGGLFRLREPLVEARWLAVGEGCERDPNVWIGYRPGRRIDSLLTRIGPNATVRTGTVIYAGSTIGAGLQTGHNVVIREQNEIGDGFQIWNNSVIDYGCRIGDRVKIHANCYVAQRTVLEDDVFFAPGVTIANDIHPGCPLSGECMRGPRLERGVQVGVNATIVPYVRIGAFSLIASGTVVTRDVPPFSLVQGNPGRVVKEIWELGCKTGLTDKPYHREAIAELLGTPLIPED